MTAILLYNRIDAHTYNSDQVLIDQLPFFFYFLLQVNKTVTHTR